MLLFSQSYTVKPQAFGMSLLFVVRTFVLDGWFGTRECMLAMRPEISLSPGLVPLAIHITYVHRTGRCVMESLNDYAE